MTEASMFLVGARTPQSTQTLENKARASFSQEIEFWEKTPVQAEAKL